MCGIAGIFASRVDPDEHELVLDRMGDAMRHRGPDARGTFVDRDLRAGLVSRRLSIVDLAGGNQPISNEDGTVHVVFNGEIYNHLDLRRDLEARGHVFRTRCDTEAIVHLYEEHGAGGLERLHGMFAAAILDVPARRLLLARDGTGMKPLYWTRSEEGFFFASEVRGLLASGRVKAEPDFQAIGASLTAGFIPAPATGFRNIHKLAAGRWLSVTADGVTSERFWRLRFEAARHRPADEAAQDLERILSASVRDHIAADVPVGALVSGGWDSSLVAAWACRAGHELETFSIVFPDHPEVDEQPYARRVAEHLGTKHHEIAFRTAELPTLLSRVVATVEEPVMRAPAILQHRVAELAATRVKCVLSGEGADEVFGGYRWLGNRWFGVAETLRPVIPGAMARMLRPLSAHWRWRTLFGVAAAPDRPGVDMAWIGQHYPEPDIRLLADPVREGLATRAAIDLDAATRDSCADALQRRLSLEFAGPLADGILLTGDKVSMAHSIELRMPFLHRPVLDFASALPSDLKFKDGREKRILEHLVGTLPPEIARRRKQGLGYPRRLAADPAISRFMREILLDAPREGGLFVRDGLERRLNDGALETMWPMVFLQAWWNAFFA
ncbi:MAG: asparagine synthase (glutamine-hydrolyzing) [Phycisphaeraceae bacterium]|nr:asparagine synthase (glutamine-hydrolyzing) [Phycisphaeraceae bacterium]